MVGGIGVMNIMLVSVTERTREIGVRMAVGARRADIIAQFLMEAVLICLIGGAAGVLLAFGLGALIALAMPQLPMSFSALSVVLAVVSSCLVGVAFGYLPARNAARLEPVQALARD
ncbi:FtsX-like permease family protein [Variovorax sp. UC74_104]|uniref:FtsX-like permease family protein n=1 Tax=Variovorax sp. UC74_104 TaxID=3374555 RepID=UPI0037569A0E